MIKSAKLVFNDSTFCGGGGGNYRLLKFLPSVRILPTFFICGGHAGGMSGEPPYMRTPGLYQIAGL
ncbi:MAG: hypothetical protein Q4C86_04785 [bacterium]|nr:hypothetical protein [bacterium]